MAQPREPPSTRLALTHRFEIAGHKCYIFVGLYEVGAPGEIFVTMASVGRASSRFVLI